MMEVAQSTVPTMQEIPSIFIQLLVMVALPVFLQEARDPVTLQLPFTGAPALLILYSMRLVEVVIYMAYKHLTSTSQVQYGPLFHIHYIAAGFFTAGLDVARFRGLSVLAPAVFVALSLARKSPTVLFYSTVLGKHFPLSVWQNSFNLLFAVVIVGAATWEARRWPENQLRDGFIAVGFVCVIGAAYDCYYNLAEKKFDIQYFSDKTQKAESAASAAPAADVEEGHPASSDNAPTSSASLISRLCCNMGNGIYEHIAIEQGKVSLWALLWSFIIEICFPDEYSALFEQPNAFANINGWGYASLVIMSFNLFKKVLPKIQAPRQLAADLLAVPIVLIIDAFQIGASSVLFYLSVPMAALIYISVTVYRHS